MDPRFIKPTEYTCPICNDTFVALRVRKGAAKFVDTDSDLRPYFEGIDPVLYEIVTCPNCGYSSISKTFDNVRKDKISEIREKLDNVYEHRDFSNEEYDYEEAIYRFKIAILIAKERNLSNGELFYLYLKLAWIFRVIVGEENIKYEYVSLKRAFEYGELTFLNESMPVVDIEEDVFIYLLGEIGRRIGQFDKALKYVSQIVVSQTVSARLKERAKQARETIKIDKLLFEKDNVSSEVEEA